MLPKYLHVSETVHITWKGYHMLTNPDFVVRLLKHGSEVDVKITPELFDERRLNNINDLAFQKKVRQLQKRSKCWQSETFVEA